MKQFLLLFLLIISFASCKKDEITLPAVATTPITTDLASAKTIASGNFISGVHTTSGMASWLNTSTKQVLYLKQFKTDAGPDLKVYLSKDLAGSSFISLGDLKAASGDQEYDIPATANKSEYKYVLIWCQRFSVLFGSANIN